MGIEIPIPVKLVRGKAMNNVRLAACYLAVVASASAQPVITHIVIDAISHSTARVTATSSVAPSGGERVRYGLTSSYEGGPGGGLNNQGFGYCNHDLNFCPGIYQIYGTLSGLAPATTYHVQMQASTDGVNWGSSTDTTFTTLSLPANHPAYPISPETFDTSYPDTSAYTTAATATNCADLNAKLAKAVMNRGAGWILPVAPGLFDTTSGTCMLPPIDPSALAFKPENVNTTTNSITIPGHGLAANQQVRFATLFSTGSCLPSSNPGLSPFCQGRGNIIQGVVYYVVHPTANTLQVSATPSGPAIAITDQGRGTMFVVPTPSPGGPQIIIRTATPDGAFCPAGVRCMGSTWSSAMAMIKVRGGLWTSVNGSAGPLVFQTNVGTHDIRLVGLEITNTDASALATTSTDPRPTFGFISTNASDAPTRIIFDRCYIHGLGYPNRIYRPFVSFDGAYMALINSDLEHWDFWRPWLASGTPGVTGFAPTMTGNTVNYASSTGNTYYMGSATCTAPSALSITFSGSSSGTAYSYFTMGCVPTFQVPIGMSATCAGTGSNNGGPPQRCVVSAVASPAYPVDAANGGGLACGELGTITVTAGTPTAAGINQGFSQYATEGTQGLIAGWGPGPYQMYNNFVSGSGLLWHWDDSSSGVATGKSYVLQRNTFFMPPYYMTGGPASDNLDYEERNGPEWKNGQSALIDGNTWTNFFSAVSSIGSAITLTGRGGGVVSDFEIRNNTFTNGTTMLTAIGGIATGGQQVSQPFTRLWVHNNLNINPNGWKQFSAVNRSFAVAYPLYIGNAMEDIIVEHNTFFNTASADPSFLHLLGSPEEGVVIRNNILWVNNDNNSYGLNTEQFAGNIPNCSFIAEAAMNCAFVQGIGKPQFSFEQNALIGYYAHSQNFTGNVDSVTLAREYSGLGVLLPPGETPQSRMQYVGFTDAAAGNFALNTRPTSPYVGKATDHTDLGVNQHLLDAAQGAVSGVNALSITSTAATVFFDPADGVGCPVDYSTDPGFATFVRVPSTNMAGNIREIWHAQLTGLTYNTLYYYRVLCAVQQPVGSFKTSR